MKERESSKSRKIKKLRGRRMKKTISSIHDLLNELAAYFKDDLDADIWVYSGKATLGSLLLKNTGNSKRIILKPSDSANPVGGTRIEEFMSQTTTFKGHAIDNYMYIARRFKDNAKRLAKVDRQLTLMAVDIEKKSLTVYGSMNIDLNVLNHLVQFGEKGRFSVSYDFEGLLKHQGFGPSKAQPITQIEERQPNPVVFFSYSWDDEKHKLWVLKLASNLIKSGIDVIIDEWNLEDYKNDLHYFMESGIKESDKIIMICTPNYALRANDREGGVGVEHTIITGEFYEKDKANKYIPIVRSYKRTFSECLPAYMKTKYAIDFSREEDYKGKFDELVRKILNVPRFKKPQLGSLPDLRSDEL